MEGYKVFEPDWTCRGFQYVVGKTYEEDVTPVCCDRGFHFCEELKDCFNYYPFNPKNKVAKVVALGEVDEESDNSKCCTNKIQIVEEITWEEVLRIVNLGKANNGLCNTGNCNTGDWNTGDWNTGNKNTGHRNTGNCNTGKCNTGDCNTGDCNTGNRNTGNKNTGHRNTGNCNTGNCNTGDCNTGDCNTGNRNTGNWNTGDRNTGNKNTGHRNTGDFNISDNNSGCFNVDEHKLLFFDQETEMTWNQWRNSRAYYLLCDVDSRPTKWIYADYMTDQEKADYPTYETTGGYLKDRDISKDYQEWWDKLNDDQKQCIKEIPNFDAKKFQQITGIDAGVN